MELTVSKAGKYALVCYSAIIAPVVNQMVTNAGVNLPALDTGWQSVSVIAYSTKVGLIFIGVAIVLQLVLFFLKWTNVFMASDLWNNYSFMVWGSMLYALTGSMMLAMGLMVTQLLYILLFSEACAKRWSTYYEYDNCCMTAPHHLESLPFAVFMNWLLGKIGFNKIKLNAQTLQKKLGILGEPMFIGLVVGALIGIIGNFNALAGEGALAAWGTVSSAAVSTAAIMAVFPKVAGIFAGAFTTLTDAYKSKAAKLSLIHIWCVPGVPREHLDRPDLTQGDCLCWLAQPEAILVGQVSQAARGRHGCAGENRYIARSAGKVARRF